MRKLLWIGDAGCESGFAKCTHNILEAIRQTWDVSVLGINYRGDPHPWPYPIYPAYVPGGDLFGVRRLIEICDKVRPDLIVLQNDPWNIPAYIHRLKELKTPPPVVGIIAVDGLNCLGRALNKLTRVIFWTHFAEEAAKQGGLTAPSGIVPLGVDLTTYYPQDRREARRKMGLPQDVIDGFIFGNINRNQPRKRLDLSIRYFARWRQTLPEADRRRTFLYLHVAPTGDQGFDCEQLAKYYGQCADDAWLILAEPEMYHGTPERWVAMTLNAFDVQISTTQGEGWGLTTMEGMACGIPQILPQWSALGEWAAPAAYMVPCTATSATPKANAIGGLADEDLMKAAFQLFYYDQGLREVYSKRGLSLVEHEQYRWTNVAAGYAAEIERAWEGRCGSITITEDQPCPSVPA